MSKKIHSIALVFVGLLFSVAAAKISANTSAELEQAKSNIVSLINDGSYAQAQTQTQKSLADFSLTAKSGAGIITAAFLRKYR